MFEKSAGAASETPWGQPWAALLSDLRPTLAEDCKLRIILRRIETALRASDNLPVARVVAGGPFGKGTHCRGRSCTSLDVYAVFDSGRFDPADYYSAVLKPIFEAIKAADFANAEDRGLAIEFVADGVEVRLFGAGVLYGGAKDLLLPSKGAVGGSSGEKHGAPGATTSAAAAAGGMTGGLANGAPGLSGDGSGLTLDPAQVHAETSCGVLRVDFIRAQCPLYKDMVRVGKKWRDGTDFMVPGAAMGDYLIELLMMEAFHGAGAAEPSPDLYSSIFRRFLALVATQSGTGSEAIAADTMPTTFLVWTTYYNRATVDHCLARGLLKIDNADATLDGNALVVVDPAVPYVNVARTVTEWGELRVAARESLAAFQSTEMVEILDVRLQTFSEKVSKTLGALSAKLEHLQEVERAPRRWTGHIQIRDVHLNSDAWAPVAEMELRCLKWILHARRPRMEGTGYTQVVDVSLQLVGDITRQMDVDVSFRGSIVQIKFDENNDHALVARRSEVMRNRDYALQVTIC